MSPKVADFKIIKVIPTTPNHRNKKIKKKNPQIWARRIPRSKYNKKKNHQDREPRNYVDLWTPC